MANPNIVNTASIVGNNSQIALSTTSLTAVVSNAVSSGKIYKINSLIASNVNGTSAATITVSIYSEDDVGGTGYPLVSTLDVPAKSSIIVIDKTTAVYLKEDQSIGAIAGSVNDLVITANWEEIS